MSKKKNNIKTNMEDETKVKNMLLTEIISGTTLIFTLFLWLSLAKYNINSIKTHLFITGKLGFNTASFFANMFGYSSFFIPVLLLFLLLIFIKRKFLLYFFINLLFFITLMPFFKMLKTDILNWGKYRNWIGTTLYKPLHTLLGETGLILFFILIFSTYLILTFKLPIFSSIIKFFKGIFDSIMEKREVDLAMEKFEDKQPEKIIEKVEETPEDKEEKTKEPKKEKKKKSKKQKQPKEEPKEEEIPQPFEEETCDEIENSELQNSQEIQEESEKITVIQATHTNDELSQLKTNLMSHSKDYKLPKFELLTPKISKDEDLKLQEEAERTGKLIQKKLGQHKLKVTVKNIILGPVVTMFELELGEGMKVGQVIGMQQDLGIVVGGRQLRVVPRIPGKPYIGIEVPNDTRITIRLRNILESPIFEKESQKGLPIVIGETVDSTPLVGNLSKMPHLLVAGTTGSGKSVGVNAFIMSLLFKFSPEEVQFIMIDPKGNEFNVYEGIPHLLMPVVVDAKKAALALKWAVNEMEERFRLLAENMVRDIAGYNKKVEATNKNLKNEEHYLKKMPFIVIIIDEFADLMTVASKDVEMSVQRIAQKARAVGLHLIIATQRPTRDVITGLIKANLPVRIAFRVASALDSRTILDTKGAEVLLGNGDMLYIPPGSSEPIRVHGAFVETQEIKEVVKFIKEQAPEIEDKTAFTATGSSPEEFVSNPENVASDSSNSGDLDEDPLYNEIISFIKRTRKCSASLLQRKFKVGYNRASRIVEELEEKGIVGPQQGSKPREVLLPKEE